MASIPMSKINPEQVSLNHQKSLMQKRHTLRNAAAIHDPPLPGGPFVILSRSDEAEPGII